MLSNEDDDCSQTTELDHQHVDDSVGVRQEDVNAFIEGMERYFKDDHERVLLYILVNLKTESKAEMCIEEICRRGAYGEATGENGNTPLHVAVLKNWTGVALKLLQHTGIHEKENQLGQTAFNLAVEQNKDDMAALLLSYLPKFCVRIRCLFDNSSEDKLYLHKFISLKMEKTVIVVLDSLIEQKTSSENFNVYYDVLESDENGNTPDVDDFNCSDITSFQAIALQGNKNIVCHNAVRLLTRHKWKEFGKNKFRLNCMIYLLTLFSLTFCAVTSVMSPDPAVYSTPLDFARATLEVVALVMVFRTFITDLAQFRKVRLGYFKDVFNIIDLLSATLLLLLPGLRFSNMRAQWYVFAVGFVMWVIQIFKFAAVFRQTGAYALMLERVIKHDLRKFGIMFSIVMLAFSVSFFLFLKGDNDIDTHVQTSTIWGIVLVGLRTLSEAQPVVEYTGGEGYSTTSSGFMLVFLVCCVVLLNILIAQLNDTYQNVQQDAERGFEASRAWLIAHMERNTFYMNNFCRHKEFRKTYYTECEDIKDLGKALRNCSIQRVNDMTKCNCSRDVRKTLIDIQDQNRKIEEKLDTLLKRNESTSE